MNAEEWNEAYPPGTPVRYWPIKGDDEHLDTKTRSQAWTLAHGESVVKIEGRSGGVCLSHCRPLQCPDAIEIAIGTQDVRERMTALARSFPTLSRADGLEPFDPEKLDDWAMTGGTCHAGLVAARFILTVWSGQAFSFGQQTYLKQRKPDDLYRVRVETPWRCGLFDVVDALSTWDAKHRAAFLGWAMNPWWP